MILSSHERLEWQHPGWYGIFLKKLPERWILQFRSFHWLSHHGIWTIIPFFTNMPSDGVISWLVSYFYFSLVFHVLGAFVITHLFYSRLLDIRWSAKSLIKKHSFALTTLSGFSIERANLQAILIKKQLFQEALITDASMIQNVTRRQFWVVTSCSKINFNEL